MGYLSGALKSASHVLVKIFINCVIENLANILLDNYSDVLPKISYTPFKSPLFSGSNLSKGREMLVLPSVRPSTEHADLGVILRVIGSFLA